MIEITKEEYEFALLFPLDEKVVFAYEKQESDKFFIIIKDKEVV